MLRLTYDYLAYLRLKGVDALQHPVYREITRVKQYFDKMKALQQPEEPTMKLDKEAAGRFIKHGLVSIYLGSLGFLVANCSQAGNNKIDLERAEREAKERAQATFKAAMLAKKNAAKSQEATASNDDSTGPAAEQSDEESDKEMQTAPSTGELREKQKSKGSNTNPEIKKSKKKSKKAKHASGADRKDAKKERRSKKEKHRKAQKAQQSA